jgi:hypothetical protein
MCHVFKTCGCESIEKSHPKAKWIGALEWFVGATTLIVAPKKVMIKDPLNLHFYLFHNDLDMATLPW